MLNISSPKGGEVVKEASRGQEKKKNFVHLERT